MAKKKSATKDGDGAGGSHASSETMDATASLIFSDSNPFKRKSEAVVGKTNPHKSSQDVDEGEKKMKTLIGAGTEDSLHRNENDVDKTEKKSKKKRKREEVEKSDEIEHKNIAEIKHDISAVGAKRKHAELEHEDVVASSIKKEDGFDSEDKLLRTIFVGNLPLKVKKKAILKEFAKFGEIESVRIRSIPLVDTKVPRKGAVMRNKINEAADNVHAYVVFKAQKSAEDAQSNNMAMLGGHHIRVDRACPPRKKMKKETSPLFDTQRTVFLGNLPFDVKDEEIYQLFSSVKELENQVEGVRVIRDPHGGIGKGFAYLLLKTKEAAKIAVKQRSMKIREREVRIFPAKQESTLAKRKSSFSSDKDEGRKQRKSSVSSTPTKVKGAMSYQGLRANKVSGNKRTRVDHEDKRKEKRPSVAVRKGNATSTKDSDRTKLERKRKFDKHTPDGSFGKKGAKRHKSS